LTSSRRPTLACSRPVFTENPTGLSSQFAASLNGRFKFQKSRQLFIGAHNKALSVVAVRVSNEDRSSLMPGAAIVKARLAEGLNTSLTRRNLEMRS